MSGFAHELERKEVTKTDIPVFHVGDTLDVHVRIKEGDKERIQIFTGVCIARKGGALRETFTVRRIVEGEGVERIFPLHSPNVAKIEVKRAGKVRRAKLYYLRDRVGKATRIMEKLNAGHLGKLDDSRTADEKPAPKAEEQPAAAEEQPAEATEQKEEAKEEAKAES
ncbi:MAG: 50S ribosomal protein L19 [Planctomycetes bacterium]|nr:50S ribosomal protein L19 [Planctomycetota bacterium]